MSPASRYAGASLNRRMVRGRRSPIGPGGVGADGFGAVRWAGARSRGLQRRQGSRATPSRHRSRCPAATRSVGSAQASTRSVSLGFDRSRSDRIGRPSAVASMTGQGTPTAGSSQANPSSSDPSYGVGHEIQELERLEGEEPMGDPGRDLDPFVHAQLAGLDDRRRPAGRRASAGRRRARRARDRSPRSSDRADADGSAGREGRRPPTSRGSPGRSSASHRAVRRRGSRRAARRTSPSRARGTNRARRRTARSRRSERRR